MCSVSLFHFRLQDIFHNTMYLTQQTRDLNLWNYVVFHWSQLVRDETKCLQNFDGTQKVVQNMEALSPSPENDGRYQSFR